MKSAPRIRITFWRLVLAAVFLVGAYATVIRFFRGLGPSTGLSDKVPWGLWISFDVVASEGFAAGGFTLAAAVYIFKLEKYRPILRPTILTAFLGYVLAVISLLYDIGRPWNIWCPMVFHNLHSLMFLVAWCVMLYTTVLALEFAPAVLERFGLLGPLKLLQKLTPAIVILGVLLSTVHQSALGALFVIVPAKVHGLWYTPWLPLLFYISSIATGLSMTIFESTISHRAFGTSLHKGILQGLAKGIVAVLGIYLVARFATIAHQGNLCLIFDGSRESRLFVAEIAIGYILPIILLSVRRVRQSQMGLFYTSVIAILGFLLNRMNTTMTGVERYTNNAYFPSFLEVATTVFVLALGLVAFGLIARYFPIFPVETEGQGDAHGYPVYAPLVEQQGRGAPGVATPVGTAFFGAIALALAITLYLAKPANPPIRYDSKVPQPGLFTTSLRKIDTEEGALRLPADYVFPGSALSAGPVTFSHKAHVQANEEACTNCHLGLWRMEKPGKGYAMDEMHKKCGSCHNGKRSFDRDRECSVCHVAPGEGAKQLSSFQKLGLASDIIIRSGSPGIGSVLFSHESHVNSCQYRCSECHPKYFRMMTSAPQGGLSGMNKRMSEGHQCASCHNGKVGFKLSENCKKCHNGGISGSVSPALSAKVVAAP